MLKAAQRHGGVSSRGGIPQAALQAPGPLSIFPRRSASLVKRQHRHQRHPFPLRAGADEESAGVEVQLAEPASQSEGTKRETVGEILRTRKQGKADAKEKPLEIDGDSEFALNKINPYVIGRKSRAAFDDVWSKFARLGSFATSMDFVDDVNDLEAPQAAYTTVLLLGATGRVGRVMLRKLLLRGYTVKVLSRDESSEFPKSVIVVNGDVGDYQQVREVVKGVDKVIYCASARSTLTADLARVEHTGVANVVKALQDQYNKRAISGGKRRSSRAKPVIAEFKKEAYADDWTLEHVGPPSDLVSTRTQNRGQDYASVKLNGGNLQFTGAVYSRNGFAEVGASVADGILEKTDGLLLRVLGDGQPYTCLLVSRSGETYSSRFNTKQGYSTVRLPYNTFRPLDAGNEAPVCADEVVHITIRFEPKRGGDGSSGFKLEIDFIKALPSGGEPDFVLISRTTQSSHENSDNTQQLQLAKVIDFKKKGEDALRNSGLGYTIIRAGELVEEPGGYKALLFDQSNRIQDSISCADLADICVKGLHEANARNKTFDVCNENLGKDGLQKYELIAHLPDKSSNYIKSALSDLKSMS